MKKLVIGGTAVMVALLANVVKADTYIDPKVEEALVKVCEAATLNKPAKMTKVLRSYRISFKSAANKIVCNGEPLIQFAMLNGAKDSARLLAKRANVDLNELLVMNEK